MARYWIVRPCSYVHEGRAVVHTSVPAVAEIEPDVAAGLGSAVRAVNKNPDVEPVVEAPVEQPRRTRKAIEEKPEGEPASDGA